MLANTQIDFMEMDANIQIDFMEMDSIFFWIDFHFLQITIFYLSAVWNTSFLLHIKT